MQVWWYLVCNPLCMAGLGVGWVWGVLFFLTLMRWLLLTPPSSLLLSCGVVHTIECAGACARVRGVCIRTKCCVVCVGDWG